MFLFLPLCIIYLSLVILRSKELIFLFFQSARESCALCKYQMIYFSLESQYMYFLPEHLRDLIIDHIFVFYIWCCRSLLIFLQFMSVCLFVFSALLIAFYACFYSLSPVSRVTAKICLFLYQAFYYSDVYLHV